MSPDISDASASTTDAWAEVLAPAIPCTYCRVDMPAGEFEFRSPAKRLVTATCPSCHRQNTLSAVTWRRWAGLPLPIAPPKVADLTVAGRYIPAGMDGEPIAGDFFDINAVAPDRIVIAVGDVSGHGARAAARMKVLRTATRNLGAELSSPVEMLQQLDQLQGLGDPEDIATLWIGTYDPLTGVLHYASAGHLPPVMAGFGDRTILLAEADAPPLGTGVVGSSATLEEVYLPIGGYLVAFSDGLVERPGLDLDHQLYLLRDVIERASGVVGDGPTAQQLVDSVLAELVPEPASARDDVCLAVLRREKLPSSDGLSTHR